MCGHVSNFFLLWYVDTCTSKKKVAKLTIKLNILSLSRWQPTTQGLIWYRTNPKVCWCDVLLKMCMSKTARECSLWKQPPFVLVLVYGNVIEDTVFWSILYLVKWFLWFLRKKLSRLSGTQTFLCVTPSCPPSILGQADTIGPSVCGVLIRSRLCEARVVT